MKTIQIQSSPPISEGEDITIEGCGKSAKGHQIVNGRFVHNGRKAKVKVLDVFKVVKSTGGKGG